MMENCIFSNTLFVLVILTIHNVFVISQETTNVIETRAGTYRGLVRDLEVFGETKTVEKYLGIPYAESPKRFQKPAIKVPLSPDSVYDATRFRPSCSGLQIPYGGIRKPDMNVERSEDCLFLNMYKPSSQSASLAVVLFFHGGGFVKGTPQILPGDMLSAYGDVIYISVNYRQAVYGFLSTGDKTLPGNLGLWDQHTAIKWVHEYIADFGGDPNRVTVAGHSAGSASAIYQSMFPKNRGLFQRAIGLAGSLTCPWSFQPEPLEATRRFGELVGCDMNVSSDEIVRCIETKSGEKIDETLNKKENGFVRFPMEFVTVVDGEFLVAEPHKVVNYKTALSDEAKDFFSSIDFMTGMTSGEGAMHVNSFVGVYDTENFALTRDEFEKKTIPEIVKIMYGDDVPGVVADIIVHKYTNWTDPNSTENIRQSFMELSGDYDFNFHAKLISDFHATLSDNKGGTTFGYRFEAFPSQHIPRTPTWAHKPVHADELVFLFGYDKDGLLAWTEPYSEDYKPADWELRISKLFMTLLTNFVKTGDPNKPVQVEEMTDIVWPQYDSVTGKYLAIDRNMTKNSARKHFCADSYDFWHNLIPKVIESTCIQRKVGSCFNGRKKEEKEKEFCDSTENCSP